MIFACVRVGDLYPMLYVEKLRNMVDRNYHAPYRLVCLTDRNERCKGVEFLDISGHRLTGWWAKMCLFRPQWREGQKVVYLDLDTVVNGSLDPLDSINVDLAICANFARQHGNKTWPCKYGSCVMVLGEHLNGSIWNVFCERRNEYLREFARFGDQKVIEDIYPQALLLQEALPGYLISYRSLRADRPDPERVSIVNFGGKSKPENCELPWIKEVWR